MTRIAIDARYIGKIYTGIGTWSMNYIMALSKLNVDAEFHVLIHSSFSNDLRLPDNFIVHKSNSRPVSIGSCLYYDRSLSAVSPDAYHTLAPIVPLWGYNNTPIISTVHDLQPLLDPDFTGRRNYLKKWTYDQFYQTVYPKCMRRSDWIVCPSFSTKQNIAEAVPDVADRVLVVHEAVPDDVKKPTEAEIEKVRREINLPERFVLYIGSTRPNKNLMKMLLAFDEFVKKRPDQRDLHWVLVIKPDRFWEPVSAMIRDKGLTNRVLILEQVNSTMKNVLFELAELLYFVTKYEGFGLPVLEAQAIGLPVLASTHSSLPEIAGTAALLADADSTDSIVSKLEYYYDHHAELNDLMIREGLVNVKRFSWDKVVREHIILYKVLAGLTFDEDILVI